MSTSKGTGIKARDITAILPSEVARFLLVRTPPRKAIDFDPTGMTIPDLFDEFDRCAQEYWHDSANDLGRVFHFSQINNWYRKDVYLPRFRDIANVIQLHTKDPEDHFRDTTIGRRFDEGLATSGLGLLREIGVPATKKAMARFLDVVAVHRGIRGGKKDMGVHEKTAQLAKDVVRYGADVVKDGAELAGRTVVEETGRSVGVLTSEIEGVAGVADSVREALRHFRDRLARLVFPNL